MDRVPAAALWVPPAVVLDPAAGFLPLMWLDPPMKVDRGWGLQPLPVDSEEVFFTTSIFFTAVSNS